LNYQVSVMALLRTLCRQRDMVIVAVLHDINLASAYCDSIVFMQQGRVYASGTPREVITRGTIQGVYGNQVSVSVSATTGRPFVLPGNARVVESEGEPGVFVIGGGGSATPLLNALAEAGVNAVAGVLNVGDADWLTCRALGFPVIEEEPFSPVTQDSLNRAKARAALAGTIVVAPVPFGPGNLANLEIAAEAARQGKAVVVMGVDGLETRDYTLGRASSIVSEILTLGALDSSSETDTLSILRRCH